MKREPFDPKRVAPAGADGGMARELICRAQGCPNAWTLKSMGLCVAHGMVAEYPAHWPHVTQQEQWQETERARLRNEMPVDRPPLTLADKRAIVDRLKAMIAAKGLAKPHRAVA